MGRPGVGKTRWLLERRQHLAHDRAGVVTPVDYDLPSLTFVTRLAKELQGDQQQQTELWARVWRRAIVRAALAYLLREPDILPEDPETQDYVARVHACGDTVGCAFRLRRSIFAEFETILKAHRSAGELNEHLYHAEWDEIEHCFVQLVCRSKRPLCFFLDTIDNESPENPLQWLWCQTGVLAQVLSYARTEGVGENLQIYVGIRDRTWQALRETLPPHVFALHPSVSEIEWTSAQLLEFLAERLSHLGPDFLLTEPGKNAAPAERIEAWLGTPTVHNTVRDVDERVTTYILRHTRLIPRDVVTVGNLLSRQVAMARADRLDRVPDKQISRAVAESARLSGIEELRGCADELLMDHASNGNGRNGGALHVQEALMNAVERCGTDVLEREELIAHMDGVVGGGKVVATVLRRHGLIGEGPTATGSFNFTPPALLGGARPLKAPWIALHPCLCAPLGLAARNQAPIVPFREEP